MSREALGVAGAAVGYFIGGPAGAQIGFALGTAAGAYLYPMQVQGPRLGEIPVQTARDGGPIPIGWGIAQVRGNIIQQNPTQEVEVTERQGKGGGTEVTHYEYYKTFAIGLARSYDGPIVGVRRVWENDKLVYDATETPAIPVAESQAFWDNVTLYLGTEDQTADPELEAHWGVGDTPAFRGLAYIVFNNYDLTNFAAAIPQYAFEIQFHSPVPSTSWVYPLEATTKMQIGIAAPTGFMFEVPEDYVEMSFDIVQGTLEQIVLQTGPYEDKLDLAFDVVQGTLTHTTLQTGPYEDKVDMSFDVVQGSLRLAVIQIAAAPIRVQIGISAPTGSMTAV